MHSKTAMQPAQLPGVRRVGEDAGQFGEIELQIAQNLAASGTIVRDERNASAALMVMTYAPEETTYEGLTEEGEGREENLAGKAVETNQMQVVLHNTKS